MAFYYYSYELPRGDFQTIAAAQARREAQENAGFQARGCTDSRRKFAPDAKPCRYFIDTDLDALRLTIMKHMMETLAQRLGMSSPTQADWAAILQCRSSQTMNYKLNGKRTFTEKDIDNLALLLKAEVEFAKSIIAERLEKTLAIKEKNAAHLKKWRQNKKE